MNYKVKQIIESHPTIEKTLTETELTELGFFPLEPSEKTELEKTGSVSICGAHKYTIIKPVET